MARHKSKMRRARKQRGGFLGKRDKTLRAFMHGIGLPFIVAEDLRALYNSESQTGVRPFFSINLLRIWQHFRISRTDLHYTITGNKLHSQATLVHFWPQEGWVTAQFRPSPLKWEERQELLEEWIMPTSWYSSPACIAMSWGRKETDSSWALQLQETPTESHTKSHNFTAQEQEKE